MNGVKTGLAVRGWRGGRGVEGGRAGPVRGRRGRRGLEGGRAGPAGRRPSGRGILVTIADDCLARPRSGAHRLRRQVRVDDAVGARPGGGGAVQRALQDGPGARAAASAGRRGGRGRRRREGEQFQLLRKESFAGVAVARPVLARRRSDDLWRVIDGGGRPRVAGHRARRGPPRRGHDHRRLPGVRGRAGGGGQERPRRVGLARQARPAPALVRDGVLAAAEEEVGPQPLARGLSARLGIGRARLSLSWTR